MQNIIYSNIFKVAGPDNLDTSVELSQSPILIFAKPWTISKAPEDKTYHT